MCSQFYHVLACCQKPVTVAEIEGIVGRSIGLAAYYSQGKQGKGWMHENLRRKGTESQKCMRGPKFWRHNLMRHINDIIQLDLIQLDSDRPSGGNEADHLLCCPYRILSLHLGV